MAADLDPELFEKPPGQRTGSYPGCCFPGAGSLQNVTGVMPVVLEHSYEVGVPGARAGDPAAPSVTGCALGRHDVLQLAQSRF